MSNKKIFLRIDYYIINAETGIPYTELMTRVVEHNVFGIDSLDTLSTQDKIAMYTKILMDTRFQLTDHFWKLIRKDSPLRELVKKEVWSVYFVTPIEHCVIYTSRSKANAGLIQAETIVVQEPINDTVLSISDTTDTQQETSLTVLTSGALHKKSFYAKVVSFFRKHILVID